MTDLMLACAVTCRFVPARACGDAISVLPRYIPAWTLERVPGTLGTARYVPSEQRPETIPSSVGRSEPSKVSFNLLGPVWPRYEAALGRGWGGRYNNQPRSHICREEWI